MGGIWLDDIDQPALQQGQKRPLAQKPLADGEHDIGARPQALEALDVLGHQRFLDQVDALVANRIEKAQRGIRGQPSMGFDQQFDIGAHRLPHLVDDPGSGVDGGLVVLRAAADEGVALEGGEAFAGLPQGVGNRQHGQCNAGPIARTAAAYSPASALASSCRKKSGQPA